MTSYADLLSSFAISQFDMGHSPAQARDEVEKMWRHTFLAEPGLFAAAAAAVANSPQPLAESAEKTARMAPIRAMLGAQTPEEGLLAMIAARDLLERLARELG